MSALRDIQIIDWLFKYNTRIYFETGTGLGCGLMRMIQPEYGMKVLVSIEIDEELAFHSRKTFSFDSRVSVSYCDSIYGIQNILPKFPLEAPIFFHIDSHFANSDYNLGDKPLVPHSEGDVDIRLPLWNEIKLIKQLRADKGSKDLILIDDAMLYDPLDRYDDCVARLGPNAVPTEQRNVLSKVIDLMSKTHNPQVLTISQGYLVLHPK